MIERIPPHSDEAERSVLGSVMLNKDVLFDVLEEVQPGDFYNANNKEICEAIWSLYRQNSAVDMLTVCDELIKRNSLEMVGGRTYVAALTADVPSTVNAVEYAKIVREKALLRAMILASEDITVKGYEQAMDSKEILDYAESNIFKIAQRRQKNDYVKLQDALILNIKQIDEASKKEGNVMGVPTGFKEFDEKIGGFQRGELIILAARPAMGKTAFALNIAQQSAINHGSSVIIFNLEMRADELSKRMIAMQARVESQKLKEGELSSTDWEHIYIALDQMNDAKIVIDDTPNISILEMRNKCRRLKADQGLDLIIVDYLQLMSADGNFGENRQSEISVLSRNLKMLAREMDCPVIVLSQLSRAPEQRKESHRPILSDLRDSGSIEQDADIVLFLYRDEYYNEETTKPGVCEVIIAKHRSGPTGTVELTWVSRYTKFSDKAF